MGEPRTRGPAARQYTSRPCHRGRAATTYRRRRTGGYVRWWAGGARFPRRQRSRRSGEYEPAFDGGSHPRAFGRCGWTGGCSGPQTDVVPATCYARSGEVSIAYQAFGDGALDLVFVPGFISHVELAWEEPYLARFLRRLAVFARVIFFDKRGTGLSDPVPRPPGLAERMDDIRAVMDAAGSQRAALFGVSDGGCLCIAFAVAHPDRCASLVTYGSFARRLRCADYPWGWSAERLAEVLRGMDQGWATGTWWTAANPSVADDERYQAWWARYLRAAASPSMGRGALGLNAELDIRHLLGRVAVPTLVIHRTQEQWVDRRATAVTWPSISTAPSSSRRPGWTTGPGWVTPTRSSTPSKPSSPARPPGRAGDPRPARRR